jgi:hypothetical protein
MIPVNTKGHGGAGRAFALSHALYIGQFDAQRIEVRQCGCAHGRSSFPCQSPYGGQLKALVLAARPRHSGLSRCGYVTCWQS